MNRAELELLDEWIAHSHVQDLELAAARNENLRLQQLAFKFWLELFEHTKERLRSESSNLKAAA